MNSDDDGDNTEESTSEGSPTAGGGGVDEMRAETQTQFDNQMEELSKPSPFWF